MAAPSLIAARRFSHPLRLRLQVLFAKAFEALADTYRIQAAEFVRRLRGRMTRGRGARPLLPRGRRAARDGGDGPGPGADRARADRPRLPGAGDPLDRRLDPAPARPAARRAAPPGAEQEETSLDCRMAASVSDEAVAATHVAMALETVALLEDEVSADDAIMHYVRYFNLPSIEAQIIFRRTLAAWAERHPVRDPSRRPSCADAVRCRSRPGFRSACASPAEHAGRGRSDSAPGNIFPLAPATRRRQRRSVGMRWSYTIGRIAGTEVKVHVTFLLLLALDRVRRVSGEGPAAAVSATRCSSSPSSLCILLHEFGHITMARRFGVRTPDVILLPDRRRGAAGAHSGGAPAGAADRAGGPGRHAGHHRRAPRRHPPAQAAALRRPPIR